MNRLEQFMERWFYKVGYQRAASELRRQGYPEQADKLLLEAAKIK
jgi:hypothetical protein